MSDSPENTTAKTISDLIWEAENTFNQHHIAADGLSALLSSCNTEDVPHLSLNNAGRALHAHVNFMNYYFHLLLKQAMELNHEKK